MHRRSFLTLSGAAALMAGNAHGFADLSGPRRHLIMRHALAPGGGDPGAFKLRDCSTQRNLSQAGRAQARATGAKLKTAGITVDKVLTSQWCRCLDTARLLDMGQIEEAPPLNSFFEAREREAKQTSDLRALLLALPPETNAMLVTHQVNITALLRVFPTSGEVFAFEIATDGGVTVLGSTLVPA